jgi:hypothetical protein
MRKCLFACAENARLVKHVGHRNVRVPGLDRGRLDLLTLSRHPILTRANGCSRACPIRDRTRRSRWVPPRQRLRHGEGRACGCPAPRSRVERRVHRTPRRASRTAPRAPTTARQRVSALAHRTRRAAPTALDKETMRAAPTPPLPQPRLARSRPIQAPARARLLSWLLRLLATADRSRSPRVLPIIRSMFGENKNIRNRCLSKTSRTPLVIGYWYCLLVAKPPGSLSFASRGFTASNQFQ